MDNFGYWREKEQLHLGEGYTPNYYNFKNNFCIITDLGIVEHASIPPSKTQYAYMHTMSRRIIRLLP